MARHLSFTSLTNAVSDTSFISSPPYEWELCGHSYYLNKQSCRRIFVSHIGGDILVNLATSRRHETKDLSYIIVRISATHGERSSTCRPFFLFVAEEIITREFGNMNDIRDNYPKYAASINPVCGGQPEYQSVIHIHYLSSYPELKY